MFPLSIFPLPGELVPLHIFEPRYRQLLEDAEQKDMPFGIFFNHVANTDKLGALVKLESVLKRHPSGESDIVVKCTDLFEMEMLWRTYRDRLYPGGEVRYRNINLNLPVSAKLADEFLVYLKLISINRHDTDFSVYQIAGDLNLPVEERLKLVNLDAAHQESFLTSRLKYQTELVHQADKSKNIFHLN